MSQQLKIKICGMKYADNIQQVAALQPDFMGFIFYEGSKRYIAESLPLIPKDIIKVGVFVNATVDEVLQIVSDNDLQAVQLHGDESPGYCKQILLENVMVCKSFSVDDHFDFNVLKPYEDVVDYFLFDTKSEKLRGGTGKTFNWDILKNYPSSKPFMLSGGIDTSHIEAIHEIVAIDLPIMGIDVNSKFEIEPGVKDIAKLEAFFMLMRGVKG